MRGSKLYLRPYEGMIHGCVDSIEKSGLKITPVILKWCKDQYASKMSAL